MFVCTPPQWLSIHTFGTGKKDNILKKTHTHIDLLHSVVFFAHIQYACMNGLLDFDIVVLACLLRLAGVSPRQPAVCPIQCCSAHLPHLEVATAPNQIIGPHTVSVLAEAQIDFKWQDALSTRTTLFVK